MKYLKLSIDIREDHTALVTFPVEIPSGQYVADITLRSPSEKPRDDVSDLDEMLRNSKAQDDFGNNYG